MLIGAIILFIVAAVFGLINLIALLEERPTHNRVVLLHGLIAAAAIVLVLIYMFLNGFPTPLITSLILFILAALGGLTLVSFDMKKKPVPKLLVVLHPVIAIAGLIVLIIYFLP